MNRSGRIIALTVFLCLLCLGGGPCDRGGDDKPVVLPPANWDVWTYPGMVLALDETDPSGDHLGYGSAADWSLMRGTFDASYVYIHLDVHSSPVVDESGDTWYTFSIDANNNVEFDSGDYIITWNGIEELMVFDHDANPVNIGVKFQLGTGGGLDFAVPRGVVNQYGFHLLALARYHDGTGWQDGDMMLGPERMATFIFVPPNWDIWSQPGLLLSLDATDPQGDHLGYGSTGDLSMMQGAYDSSYVYIHLDVYSSPALDTTGDMEYMLVVDANNSGDIEQGDYFLRCTGLGGYRVFDYDFNPTNISAWCRVNPGGGIDFAVARNLVNQTRFGLCAAVMHWDGSDFQLGDDMPDIQDFAIFNF